MCRARIRGVEQPIELFSVSPAPIEPIAAAAWKNYNVVLSLFERGQLSEAAELLQTIEPTSIELRRYDSLPSTFKKSSTASAAAVAPTRQRFVNAA